MSVKHNMDLKGFSQTLKLTKGELDKRSSQPLGTHEKFSSGSLMQSIESFGLNTLGKTTLDL